MTNAPHRHIIACGLLIAACSGGDTATVEKAPAAAAPTDTAQPLPVTVTGGSLTTATVSISATPVATSAMLPSAATLDPTPEQQHTGTTPPATSTATVRPTAKPTIIIEPTPTNTVTQLTDVLTALPAFTLPEIGLTEATAYDPTGLLQMEVPFIPLDNPVQVSAATATWLRPDDFVLGVERGGEARAYPISQIQYHHIVNDTIAGEPYLVTY